MPHWLVDVVAAAPDSIGTISGWTAVLTLGGLGLVVVGGIWRASHAATKFVTAVDRLAEKVGTLEAKSEKLDERLRALEIGQ